MYERLDTAGVGKSQGRIYEVCSGPPKTPVLKALSNILINKGSHVGNKLLSEEINRIDLKLCLLVMLFLQFGTIYSQPIDSSNYFFGIARKQYENSEYYQALYNTNQALRKNHENYDATYLKGMIYIQLDHYDSALSIFSTVFSEKLRFFKSSALFYGKGMAEYYLGRYDGAIKELSQYIQVVPDKWYPISLLGLSYYNLNSTDSALKYLLKSEKLKNDSNLAFFIGICYEKKEDFKSAEKYFLKSIRSNNKLDQSYAHLSSSEMMLGNIMEAEEYAKEAIKLDSNSYLANYTLCSSLDKQNKFEKLMSPALKVFNQTPKEPLASYWLALAYLQKNDTTNGFYYFERSLELSNNQPNLVMIRGLWLLDMMLYQRALNDFIYVSKQNFENDLLNEVIARSYQGIGNEEAADEYYRIALKEYENEELLQLYADFKLRKEQFDTAEIYLTRCLNINPFNPRALLDISKILLLRGKYEDLIEKTGILIKYENYKDWKPQEKLVFLNDVYYLRGIASLVFKENKVAIENISKISSTKKEIIAKKYFYTELAYLNQKDLQKVKHDLENVEDSVMFSSLELTGLKLIVLMQTKEVDLFSKFLIKIFQNLQENDKKQLAELFPTGNDIKNQEKIEGIFMINEYKKTGFVFRVSCEMDLNFLKKVHEILLRINSSKEAGKASQEAQVWIEGLIQK